MLQNILVATDGSKASERGINLGLKWAKILNSKIYGISVAEIPVLGPEFVEIFPKLIETLEKKAWQAVNYLKFNAEKEKIPFETFVYSSSAPEEVILEKAKELEVNLIIIGKKASLGRVGKTIIGKSLCPVVVVPSEAVLIWNKILIATDGSVYSQIAGDFAIKLSKNLKSELIVLSVAKREENVPYAEESVKILVEKVKNEGLKVESLVVKGEPFEKILEVAKEKNVGLIVMGCYGRTGIEKFFMGSVTERVIENSHFPVLVVKKQI